VAARRRSSTLGLPRAAALYFRLAGAPADDAGLRALLAGFTEWTALRALARRDGVSAAVRRRLRATGAAIPGAVADALAREADVLDFHRLQLERRLGEVLERLAGAGLRPVLLKGAGLGHTVYRRPLDRPMRDLDLLLPPEEAELAAHLLMEAGWRPESPAAVPAAYAGHQHLPPLREPGSGLAVVELHRDLFGAGHPFGLDADGVRDRSRLVRTPLGPVLVPAPADQLLHAGLHFAWAHELRWGFWQLAADVAALSRHAPTRGDPASAGVPWRGLAERARAARAERGLYWALRLAERLGGAPVPGPVLASLRPSMPASAEEALLRHYAHQLAPGPGNAPSVALTRRLWEVGMRPAAEGHGRSRPWAVGVAARPTGAAPPAAARLRGQFARLAAWGRYCRLVVTRGDA
jgi:hypothetical protein